MARGDRYDPPDVELRRVLAQGAILQYPADAGDPEARADAASPDVRGLLEAGLGGAGGRPGARRAEFRAGLGRLPDPEGARLPAGVGERGARGPDEEQPFRLHAGDAGAQ